MLALGLSGLPATQAADTPASARADADARRAALAARGITYNVIYTGEGLGNVAGGLRRGAVYQGKLEGVVDADLEKLVGLTGLSVHANGFQIHNSGGIARDRVGNIHTISNIEALPATRLSELWLEQKFGDGASLRFGQLAADAEFFVSSASSFFLSSDWPSITKHNLPNGGAAYPLSTPGIRLKIEPDKSLTILAAVFNGDPAGPGPGEAEEKNRRGLNFRVNDPPLLIGEVQYRTNQDRDATGLAGSLRLGGWYHTGTFDDLRFGSDGLSLAAPASSGVARRLPGNHGVYGVIDQQLYRPAGGDAESGVSLFGRISASPSDRNLINFYLDGGLVFAGPFSGRADDRLGVSVIYSRISDAVRGLDRDTIALSGVPQPVRDYEVSIELTYLAQITPNWTLQPSLQYIVHPGGGMPHPDPAASPAPLKNATVIGLRSVFKY